MDYIKFKNKDTSSKHEISNTELNDKRKKKGELLE
jgi:hypothetical protein